MKKIYKRLVTIILITALMIPIANELELLDANLTEVAWAAKEKTVSDSSIKFEALVVNPGSSERDLNFAWYANTPIRGVVQMAEYTGKGDLERFPTKITHEARATAEPVQYINGESEPYESFYTNKASVKGLKLNTKYVYRVGNAGEYSDIYTFEVKGDCTDWSFYFAGDPQLNNTIANAESNKTVSQWNSTINKMSEMNPNASLFVLGGDLADAGGSNESQYVKGLLAPEKLQGMALAPTVGNHDQWGPGTVFADHFNNPNQSEIAEFNNTPGDYWYTYHNALFIHLNLSIYNGYDSNMAWLNEHINFIKSAIEANPETDWHFVVFHEALFSAAIHSSVQSIVNMREIFAPKLSEVNKTHGIDLVLNGHDHYYSRTYVMDGMFTEESGKAYNAITDPNGIIYITANTASGIKYYDRNDRDWYYLAVSNQEKTPNISNVQITSTGKETSLHIATYRNTIDPEYNAREEDMSIVDELTITKTLENKSGSGKTLLDKKSKIMVKVPKMFSQGHIQLKVENLTKGSSYNTLHTALENDVKLKNYKVLSKVYDTSLTLAEKNVSEEGIQVLIPFSEVLGNSEGVLATNGYPSYSVYRLGEDGKAYRITNSKVEEIDGVSYIAFRTDSLSCYGVGVAASKEEATDIHLESAANISLKVGESMTLKAKAIPASVPITYSSGNSKVALVESSGKVTAVGKGTADITIKSVCGNAKKTIKITVTQPVTSIKIKPKTKTLKKGKTYTIKPIIYPSNANKKKIKYKSNKPKVAKVSSSGKVKAMKKGTAIITASTTDGSNLKAELKVTVKK